MNEPITPPPIVLQLGGIEDFETAIVMLRATGARRRATGRSGRRGSGNSRTFVIDRDITAQQAAALLAFVDYGTARGFLTVETNVPEPGRDGVEDWWEKGEPDVGLGDALAADVEEFPEGEYRLSTRPGVVSGGA